MACSGGPRPADTGSTIADTVGPDDTASNPSTTTSTPAPVGPLGLACTVGDNVLRYTCTISVDAPIEVELDWRRDDGEGPTRTRFGAAASDHSFHVDLLEFGTTYRVEARGHERSSTLTFTTQPAAFPSLETSLTITGTSTMGLIGTELACSNQAVAVVFDTATGGLVWYENVDPGGQLGMLNMVRFTDDQTIIGETGANVVEVDRQGNELARFSHDYPGCCSLNHEILDWGDLYVSQYQEGSGFRILDNIVALDASGAEVYEWRPAVHLDIPGGPINDFLHTNSQFVDGDGNLYLSWLTRDAIAKIDGTPGAPAWTTPRWIMTGDGQDGPLGNDITIDWGTITPPRFGGQHNAHLRHDGRLMFLDNDNGRGLVMTVDDAALTATVDAAYPTHEPRCGPQGTAMDTRAGNAVVACATEWVREYDLATGEQLWEAEVQCPNGTGGGWTPGGSVRWYPLDHWD